MIALRYAALAAALALPAASVLPASLAIAQAPVSTTPAQQPPSDAPLPSPAAVADTVLGGKAVHITYNSPSIRGRVIFGGLVPYDHWWRTGANPATTITTETALTIGTLEVPAGTYTLYTLPTATVWQLILNKQTGQWGTEYDEKQDLGRTPMKSKELPASQEQMSITFENVSGKSGELHVRWDKLDEFVKITAK